MKKFVALSGIDPFSEKPDATNTIYLLPQNIIHIEGFSGPYQLQSYGPDGRLVLNGKFKQILGGSVLFLGIGGQRIVTEDPKTIIEVLESHIE